jgi:hypothetical protein
MKTALTLITIAFVAGCTTVTPTHSAFQRVTVRELHDHPDRWDGRKVEVSGIAVRQFENYGLYEPVSDPCAEEPVGIFVAWDDTFLPYKTNRRGTFRGVFTTENGKVQPNGDIVITNAAPGPGPLKDVAVVKWDGPPLKRCS